MDKQNQKLGCSGIIFFILVIGIVFLYFYIANKYKDNSIAIVYTCVAAVIGLQIIEHLFPTEHDDNKE